MLQTSSATVSTSPEIAETLNNQFKSVFTIENKHNIPEMPDSPCPSITTINITAPGVYKLDTYKASGDLGPTSFLDIS